MEAKLNLPVVRRACGGTRVNLYCLAGAIELCRSFHVCAVNCRTYWHFLLDKDITIMANQYPTSLSRRISTLAVAFALTLTSSAPAIAAPKDGEKFDNWAIRCEKPDEKAKEKGAVEVCYAFQNVVTKDGNQRVLNIAVGYAPKIPDPVALITLPLGIALPPGAALTIDEDKPIQFPIERCEPGGCRAGLKLEKTLLDKLNAAKKVQIGFSDGAHRPVQVPLSMKGFTAALKTLK
jgi:invasion protein IalB